MFELNLSDAKVLFAENTNSVTVNNLIIVEAVINNEGSTINEISNITGIDISPVSKQARLLSSVGFAGKPGLEVIEIYTNENESGVKRLKASPLTIKMLGL